MGGGTRETVTSLCHQRGEYNETYLDIVEGLIVNASKHGIYTLLGTWIRADVTGVEPGASEVMEGASEVMKGASEVMEGASEVMVMQ